MFNTLPYIVPEELVESSKPNFREIIKLGTPSRLKWILTTINSLPGVSVLDYILPDLDSIKAGDELTLSMILMVTDVGYNNIHELNNAVINVVKQETMEESIDPSYIKLYSMVDSIDTEDGMKLPSLVWEFDVKISNDKEIPLCVTLEKALSGFQP